MRERIYRVQQDCDSYGAWTLYRKVRFIPWLWRRIGSYSRELDALDRVERLQRVTTGTAADLLEKASAIREELSKKETA